MSKKVFAIALALFLASASQALAATEYRLLVPIPGMSNEVNIGNYLTSMYHFVIGIVGILALVMLVLGGMKYMTAAGNPGTAKDAKDMMTSAVLGLMLALFSWIILISINPDLRFIKQPGASFKNLANELGNGCNRSYDPATRACVCLDGTSLNAESATACGTSCFQQKHCGLTDRTCLAANSAVDKNSSNYKSTGCICADGTKVELPAAADQATQKSCSQACKDQEKCGSKFFVVQIHMDNDIRGDGRYHMEGSTNKIQDFLLTNDGTYGDFNVTAVNREDRPNYSCALLVTNQTGIIENNQLYIWWVKEGGAINLNKNTIYESLSMNNADLNMTDGCCENDGEGDCGIDTKFLGGGSCNAEGAIKVINTMWGGTVPPGCGYNCTFAKFNGQQIDFVPKYDIRCVNGYWVPANVNEY
jgi:hypothetical protein